jgi:hypothetical protein
MESSVTSQISPKVYSGEISKLYKNDIDAQSELFEINIFNSILHIAPGKSISDEDNDKLVYFYVYAIKDDKVVANLGVYELLTDEQKLLYDISTFENLLLFDYYYTNPTKIKEFEITGKNNIFDYIKTHLEYIPVDKALLIYNTFARFRRDQKDSIGSEQHQSIFKKIVNILSKDIKTKGIDDEKINQLKDMTTNVETLKLVLAILEPFLNVQFSFVNKGESVDNYRNKTPDQGFTPKQYIIVSTDQTFVSTSKTLKEVEDEKPEDERLEEGEIEEGELEEGEILEDIEVEPPAKKLLAQSVEGEIKEDIDAEPKESESKVQPSKKPTIVFKEPKSKRMVSSTSAKETSQEAKIEFLGKRLPGLKSKLSESSEPKEPTDPKLSQSSEPKEPTKSKSKEAFGSFFLKGTPESKSERKESKEPESKSERKESKEPESKSQRKESKELKESTVPKPKIKVKLTPVEESGTVGSQASKPESKKTNVTAAETEPQESKKMLTPSKLKPSAPKRQSAKIVEKSSKNS